MSRQDSLCPSQSRTPSAVGADSAPQGAPLQAPAGTRRAMVPASPVWPQLPSSGSTDPLARPRDPPCWCHEGPGILLKRHSSRHLPLGSRSLSLSFEASPRSPTHRGPLRADVCDSIGEDNAEMTSDPPNPPPAQQPAWK